MVVYVFSVGWRPATNSRRPSRPTRGGFSLLHRIHVEIFGCRKFREKFEAQNPHPEFPRKVGRCARSVAEGEVWKVWSGARWKESLVPSFLFMSREFLLVYVTVSETI
jgi:hypothetical protein